MFFSAFDWQHSVLLGGAVLGGVLVGIGILMESETWSIAAMVVLLGVIIEPIFTIGLFVYDEYLARSQNEKIIALETKLAPRTLDDDQRSQLVAATRLFSGQPYAISIAAGAETKNFACLLDRLLTEATWQRLSNFNFGGIQTDAGCGPAGVNGESDIHVRYAPGAPSTVKAAAEALAGILAKDDITANAEMKAGVDGAANILLLVGAKL